MEILQIENLTFKYPETEKNALENICLSVKEGDFTVLCGESGCGKSTLLKMLKRELSPYGEKNGKILFKGTSIEDLDARTAASEIGFVLQNPEAQIVTDTVWHELAFGAESLGLDNGTIRRRAAEMASYFGIEGWFRKKCSELSGGQKQLLNLASVMVMQPKLLLLDEPTAQLDPIAASDFISTLQKLNRELGLTILLVEHRLEEVFPIADRVLLMENGCLTFANAPGNIIYFLEAKPSHPIKAGLPAAMRIFGELDVRCEPPMTVREGRAFISEHFNSDIASLDKPPYSYPSEKAVELKDIWFRYEKNATDVLRNVSLTVFKGEHFCILGGNGAGKTTALGVMAGVLKPYRGKCRINGKKITDYTANSLYIGNVALLPQNPQTVFLEKSVCEELGEVCKLMGCDDAFAEKLIKETVKRLDIGSLLEMHPYDLSGGEQQKVALAKILLSRPKILLLDEPTKGIDAMSKQTLFDIIKSLKSDGVTVITVTHDVEFAAETADRCGMFFDGELTSVETPTEFFSENNFYTTAANRISRGIFKNAILCEDVVSLCRRNGKRTVIP